MFEKYVNINNIVLILLTILLIFFVTKLYQFFIIYRQTDRNKFFFLFGTQERVFEKFSEDLFSTDLTPCNYWLGFIRLVLINKPEDLQVVLNSTDCLEKSDIYKIFKENALGEGLLTASAEKWKKTRKIVTPFFNKILLDHHLYSVLNHRNQVMVEKIRKEINTDEHFDLWDYLSIVSVDIICETALGFHREIDKDKIEFEHAKDRVGEAMSLRLYTPVLHPTFLWAIYSYFVGLKKYYDICHKLSRQIIEQKKKEFEQNDSELDKDGTKYDHNLINILLNLNKKGAELSDDDIRDEVITTIITGSETISLSNGFTLLMLAMHPKIQEKVYNEIKSVLGEEEKPIEEEDILRMTYLDQCIKETLRLFPTVPVILRKTTNVIKLSDNFILPANTNIMISPLKMHQDPIIYLNPMKWNPDNFNPVEVEKRHKYSFLAFSAGPRGCVGKKYAMISMKITLAMILKNYKFSTDVKFENIRLKSDLILRDADGFKVKLYPRLK